MSAFVRCAFMIAFLSTSLSARAAERISFPPGFKWCVATAAHQIEGYNTESDLWDWEQIPGMIKNGDKSGPACDHWNRVEEDTRLMASLGVRQYRFSVEWAKIEPREGQFDRTALEHYREELATLRKHGIEPMITLHHFTSPRWFRAHGGWEWHGAPEAFERFTALVYSELGEGVRDWVTFNEPMVHLLGGYVAGVMPPGEKRALGGLVPVLRGMLRSHALSYRKLHELASTHGRGEKIRVGVAHHLRTMDPASRWNPLDLLAAKVADQAWNWTFGDAILTGALKFKVLWYARANETIEGLKGTQDFIGVNYYTGDLIHFSPKKGLEQKTRKKLKKNDLGWDIYPEGFYRVLTKTGKRYPGLPVLITENGIADAKDVLRPNYIRDHLYQVARAIQDGVPVEAYCHWTLMDNFEWIEGFAPRFGLYETDYSTFARKPRESARLFERIARDNGFEY